MKSHLAKYLEQVNFMQLMFKRPKLSVNNPGDRKYLLDAIEGELSPENLCCDGELRGAPLRAKHQMLLGAQAEILKRDRV